VSNSGGSECFYERHDANSISTQATIILQQDHCSLTDVHGLEPPTSFTIQQLRSDEEYKSWTGVSQGFLWFSETSSKSLISQTLKLKNIYLFF
jgi:hypothetical protein